jgi:hippurate hydrolase
VAEGIAGAHDARVEVTLVEGYPPLVNDPGTVELVGRVARDLVGESRFAIVPSPMMPSEDFAYVLQRVPGAMAFLGVRPAGPGPVAGLHSPRMVLDEDALAVGAALLAAVARQALAGSRGAE